MKEANDAIVSSIFVPTSTSSIADSPKIAENIDLDNTFITNQPGLEEEDCKQIPQQNGILTNDTKQNNETMECQENKPIEGVKQKLIDETCFKTPELPTNNKKLRSVAYKKRSRTSPNSNYATIADQCATSSQYTDEELLREFVSIGKHSFLCPRSQQSLARKYPGLTLRRDLEDGKREDLIKEVVIDEFSLLLFYSMDDFNKLKECEERIKEISEAHAKHKQHEENIRSGKIKKKGRKSKAELKREIKEAKKIARKERKEQRQREREERSRRKLMLQPQVATLDDQQHDTTTKIERRHHTEAKMQRDKHRDEKKRQKQCIKAESRKQLMDKCLVKVGPSDGSSIALDFSSSNSILIKNEDHKDNNINESKIIGQHENLMTAEPQLPKPEDPVGIKRPASAVVGIAAEHNCGKNNRLIQSPLNNLTTVMPPATKMPKTEPDATAEVYGNRALLIGIAVSSAANGNDVTLSSIHDSNYANSNRTFNPQHHLTNSTLDNVAHRKVSDNLISLTSNNISNGQNNFSRQDQLQQAFSKNPDLAYNFHQSLATLYSIDPSLMTKATAKFEPGYPLSIQQPNDCSSKVTNYPTAEIPNNSITHSQNVISELGTSTTSSALEGMPSFPYGVPLASQLATLAASQSTKLPLVGSSQQKQQSQLIPFKSGRWCNMHAVIAHEIEKHQNATKKSDKMPSIGIAGPQQQQTSRSMGKVQRQLKQEKKYVAHKKNSNTNTKASSSITTNANIQKQQSRCKTSITPTVVVSAAATSTNGNTNYPSALSSAVASTSATNLQQHLNLLLTQQQQQQRPVQQNGIEAALNENQLTASTLLARFQANVKSNASQLVSSSNPLSLSSLSQQLLATAAAANNNNNNNSLSQQSQAGGNGQFFGGFPIQPLGPGSGSLTSGNSDAAAAAQLQQQAQLLATLQQQQVQLATLQQLLQQQQQQQQASLPSSAAAATLLAQFGATNPTNNNNNNPFASPASALSLQQQQNILSTLTKNSANPTLQFMSAGQQNVPTQQPISALSSSLNALQSLSSSNNNTNPLFGNNEFAGNESILAAFLTGQTIEPKVAFPPPQLPSSSSAIADANINIAAFGNSTLSSIEQQLMRTAQFGSGQQHLQQLSKLTAGSAILPPPPSSLIAGNLGIGSTLPINPIEQELLMSQMRIVQQNQQQQQQQNLSAADLAAISGVLVAGSGANAATMNRLQSSNNVGGGQQHMLDTGGGRIVRGNSGSTPASATVINGTNIR